MRSPRVYVHGGCLPCAQARELAECARRDFPTVGVEVIDLGLSSEPPPEGVFAVPTVVLDGEVISLGSPSWDELAAAIASGPGRDANVRRRGAQP